MNARTWQKLEYDKIIERLADCASFSLGKERAIELEPAADIFEAEERLAVSKEARELLRLYPTFSLGAVKDIRDAVRRAEIGGVLNPHELLAIADSCRASRMTRQFFMEAKGNFAYTGRLARRMSNFRTIESTVERSIVYDGTVSDLASERLGSIRRRIRACQEKIRERLDNFIKNPLTNKYLQENIVTIRSDRYVVPVKQEYRAQVPGVVHDTSASGSTLFVEPMAVLEYNNTMQTLQQEEEDEIHAILRGMSVLVAGFAEELLHMVEDMGELDFIMAKGRLSAEMDAVTPRLNDKGNIYLKKARHPLLGADVVPIDVNFGADLCAMVITGPNTGGKTVCLKTIGLFTLMAAAGLDVPAEPGTELSFYPNVCADIGDEQSIEQSLSTFSSHMVNIVSIMETAGYDSLVLLDELGAGTDPQEGAALAMSILENLQKVGAKVVATTHYSELKAFAYHRAGFINASVEFNVQTLMPTYRLLMGIPGKSNAFEISRRLGLAEDVISRAQEFLSPDDIQMADLISRMESDRLEAENARKEAELTQARLLEQERRLKDKQLAMEKREADILRKANEEALRIVEKSRKECEALYQELKEKVSAGGKLEKNMKDARERTQKLSEKLRSAIPEKQYGGSAPRDLQVGETVFIPRLQQHGIVLAKPNSSGDVYLQVGIIKTTLKLSDLRLAEESGEKSSKTRYGGMQSEKARSISPELDLRGMLVEEALETLDKYIDDAVLAGLKNVRIIHGKGTGALRAAVKEHLLTHPLVKSSRFGDFHEGGIGVTVAILDI